jgi:hypothetical protein
VQKRVAGKHGYEISPILHQPILQEKIVGFISYTRKHVEPDAGKKFNFTQNLKSKKEFGNPYILEKVVDYFSKAAAFSSSISHVNRSPPLFRTHRNR